MFSTRLSRLAASCVTRRADSGGLYRLLRHEACRVQLQAFPDYSVPLHISSQWTAQTPIILALQGTLRTSQLLVEKLQPSPVDSRKIRVGEDEWRLHAAALFAAGVASSTHQQCNSCTPPDTEDLEDIEDEDEDFDEQGPAGSRGRSKTVQNDPIYQEVLADAKRCIPQGENKLDNENTRG